MSQPKPRIEFPIRQADGTPYPGGESLYRLLEKETAGHYLLGAYDVWHGGVHFTDHSAPHCKRIEPVRCIADGTVVAYLLNQAYKTACYQGETYRYFTSFCLVKHRYPPTGSGEGFGYFSLYMHLLPYEEYTRREPQALPRIRMRVGDYTARSDLKGAPGCITYGLIPQGTEFDILEEKDGIGLTYARGRLVSGSLGRGANEKKAGEDVWFAYKQNGRPLLNAQGHEIWTVPPAPQRARPGYWQGQVRATVGNHAGLALYAAPTADGSVGRCLGRYLGMSNQIEFDTRDVRALELDGATVRMAPCTPADPGSRRRSDVPQHFWTKIDDNYHDLEWHHHAPDTFDTVVGADVPIKAGDPVGYFGLNELITSVHGAKQVHHQAHIEVFSADPNLKGVLSLGNPDNAWHGFNVIEETNPAADGVLDPQHMPEFFQKMRSQIDIDGDGELTASELGAALKNRRLRDRWAKLVAYHPSEWKGKSSSPKWARMKAEIASYPELLQMELERIDEFVFWDQLPEAAKPCTDGRVWHFHPVAFVESVIASTYPASRCASCSADISITMSFMRSISSNTKGDQFLAEFASALTQLFKAYGVNTCSQVAHILGQASVETARFSAFKEILNYTRKTYTAEGLYKLSRTAIDNGLRQKNLILTREQKIRYIEDHLLENDLGYARHCYGSKQYPENDYRGRGLLHLTHFENYRACARATGIRVDEHPTLAESEPGAIIASGCWFWQEHKIGRIADDPSLTTDIKIEKITKKINPGMHNRRQRNIQTKMIISRLNENNNGCAT